jgi:4-azaleucine resistance transporter AzlC
MPDTNGRGVWSGVRTVVPFLVPVFALGVSFGALSRAAGFGIVAASVMSLIVFSASAQLASMAVLHDGGGVPAAVTAGLLTHFRYLPMAAAMTPFLRGSRMRRAFEAQAVVDLSWLLARVDGGFDRGVLFGATLPQYVAWAGGTTAGAVLGEHLPEAAARGLDVIFPAFFAILLLQELTRPAARRVAVFAGLIAVAAIPFAPAGVPVLLASLAAFATLRA